MTSRTIFESTAYPTGPVTHDWQCKYRGKLCQNPRTVRLDGQPHHLCEMHRERANRNQRTSVMRRKLARLLEKSRASNDEDETLVDVLWSNALIDTENPLEIICLDDLTAAADAQLDAVIGDSSMPTIVNDQSDCAPLPTTLPSLKDVVEEFGDEELAEWLLEVADIEDVWEGITRSPPEA